MELFITLLNILAPLLGLLGLLSWTEGATSIFKRPLYLRSGIWRAFRWVGLALALYGVFTPDISEIRGLNLLGNIGCLLLALGTAKTGKKPVSQKTS